MPDAAVARLLAVVERLLDRDVVMPFLSAWELDHSIDGEQLHEDLRAAYDAVRASDDTAAKVQHDVAEIERGLRRRAMLMGRR